MMDVEFTDRYGGRAPSWLRGCHGDCEAMGYVPDPNEPPDAVFEDWPFVPCADCHGSGRVSWLVSIARIPRWIVKGARFIPIAMRKEIAPPSMTYWQRLRLAFYAAWGADIKALLRP